MADEPQGSGDSFVLQPSDVDDIDRLFALYTQKVRELEILNQSIASTARAKAVLADTISEIKSRAANDNTPDVAVEVRRIERAIVQQLAKRPDDLYRLEPRQFEELVCALLADMGLEVQLTPQTKDRGRDILAVAKPSIGEFLTIVECKKYRVDRPVSISEIRGFLYTIRDSDRASCGMLATTSYFSRDATNLAANYVYQLKLKDAQDIRLWLQKYGTWTQSSRSGFWLPGPSGLQSASSASGSSSTP